MLPASFELKYMEMHDRLVKCTDGKLNARVVILQHG